VRRAGHNRGAARDALIDLFAIEGCALTPQEIEGRLSSDRPVARASVYRALELLHSLRLITRIDVGDGVARYERAHLDEGHDHHHHHLLCGACGELVGFEDEHLEAVIHELSGRHGFRISEHEVTLRGTCPSCR